MKKIIKTQNAPLPVGPYNQAVYINGTLFVSGQIPVNPISGQIVKESIESEARQVLENIKAILSEAGMDFSNIVKTSIFITDMGNFAIVNKVYAEYFTGEFPARETIQVGALPLGVNVEISAIAVTQ
ncbi:MAG: RidA family protein [Bacteroidales bacterium]|nr:RidA family protein [Bacteroidales bacterium]